jgi:peptide-methionine (S)-S-oxide reductase
MKHLFLASAAALLLFAATFGSAIQAAESPGAPDFPPGTAIATFAGGCFWCMEPPYDKLDGVLATTSGYIGGDVDNPTYKQVSAGGTGHAEVVQVLYDPAKISFEKLLDVFWRNIDPTTPDRQFCDGGNQYRTAIFYHDIAQQKLAEASKSALEQTKPFAAPIVTEITAAGTFYAAEDYHQDYYVKNPLRYKFYRFNCGRDKRLEELWGEAHSARTDPIRVATGPVR